MITDEMVEKACASFFISWEAAAGSQLADKDRADMRAALEAALSARPASAEVEAMARRFLCWKLPDDFSPDGGITFTPPSPPHWPSGTNILNAKQAEAMVRHMLRGTSASDHPTASGLNELKARLHELREIVMDCGWHEHRDTCSGAIKWLEALDARAGEAKEWGDRLRKMLSGGQLDLEESERGWKRRAEAAEAESARLREALSAIANRSPPFSVEGFTNFVIDVRIEARAALSARQGDGE